MSKRRQHDANDTLATIPWKWRDWRASKARAVMTPEARGVYRELLDALWGEKDCSLPADDDSLAGLAGVSREYWLKVRAQVLAWFDEQDGKLTNPRALYEWKKARGYRSAKRRAGKAGAKAKWDKEKEPNPAVQQAHASAITLPLIKDGPPSPSSVSVNRHPSTVVGTEEHSRPPTPATPSEARSVALSVLGPPDGPLLSEAESVEREIRGGTTALEGRLLVAAGRLSKRTGRDSIAIMRQLTSYRKRDGTMVPGRASPAGMTAERLEKSLEDAEAWLADLDSGRAVAQ